MNTATVSSPKLPKAPVLRRWAKAALAAPLVLTLWGGMGQAGCDGRNLIDEMAPADRAAITAAADAAPFAHGLIWQATKGTARALIVGTYHMDDPRHAATLAALAPALQAAHTLLVEAGPKEIAALRQQMLENPSLIVAPPGQSLYAELPRATWDRLAKSLTARGLPLTAASRMRPWYLMTLLASGSCAEGLGGGLDMQLMTLARDRDLPIRALEPADTVFRIFNSLPHADELALLTTALAEEPQAQDGIVTLAEVYFDGDTRLMWEYSNWATAHLPGLSANDAARQQALIETLIVNGRNRAWIPVIDDAAAQGPVLVAFGALHLPGEQGVLSLLTQDGWTVTPLPKAAP